MMMRPRPILLVPLDHPWRTLALALACAALALWGTRRLQADSSLQAMFSRNTPAAAALVHVMDDFGAADDLLVLATIPANAPADADRLTRFAKRLDAAIASDPSAAPLVDAVIYKADAQTRAWFENVLIPSAVYYLDDEAYAAARERLTRPAMEAQLRQDLTMMAVPSIGQAMGRQFMADPLRLRDFLGKFVARLQAQKPFEGREGTDAFISRDGRSLLIRVRGKMPPTDIEFCKELTARIAAAGDRANQRGSAGPLELRYAGAYAIAAESARALRSDMIASVVGSVLCLQVLFLLAYRGAFRLFVLAFAPIALGVLLGFGAYSLRTTRLTPFTAVLGGILAGMAIDYSIQYLSMYLSRRDAGASPRESAEAAALGITPAAFAAWATSIVGFLAIGASSVSALRDFSILGSLGLAGAFICAVALLPMLLMLSDAWHGRLARVLRRTEHGTSASSFESHADRAAHFSKASFRFSLIPLLRAIERRRRIVLAFACAIFLAAAGMLLAHPTQVLPLESDLTVMHPRPNAALAAQSRIARTMGMRDVMLVYLHADSAADLLDLAHRVEGRLASAQAKAAGVVGSFGLASLLPDPRVVARRAPTIGPQVADRVVADFRVAVAGTSADGNAFVPDSKPIHDYEIFLHELLTRPAPSLSALLATRPDPRTGRPELRYRELADVLLPRKTLEAQRASTSPPITEAITLAFIGGPTDERAARDRAVDGLRAALAGEKGAVVTGLGVIGHDTEQTVRHDLPRLCGLAVLVVLLYLLLHFRNLANAGLAIAPTVFSLVVLLAAMRLAGQKLNMLNLIAAPLLIGIDVDYGIFLVSLARVRPGPREEVDFVLARIAPVCHAVLICGLATMIGFGSLIWTSVPAVRSLGFAVAVGIAACLVCVFLQIVPLILMLRTAVPTKDRIPTPDAH